MKIRNIYSFYLILTGIYAGISSFYIESPSTVFKKIYFPIDSNHVFIQKIQKIELPYFTKTSPLQKEIKLSDFIHFINSKKSKIFTKSYTQSNNFEPISGFNLAWADPSETYQIDEKTRKEIKTTFIPKIFSIGKVDFNSDVNSIIIKIFQLEETSYKLLNFNSRWQLISVVELHRYNNDFSSTVQDKALNISVQTIIKSNKEINISYQNETSKNNKVKGQINQNGEFIIK